MAKMEMTYDSLAILYKTDPLIGELQYVVLSFLHVFERVFELNLVFLVDRAMWSKAEHQFQKSNASFAISMLLLLHL